MGRSIRVPIIARSLVLHMHYTNGVIRFPLDEEVVRCLSAGLAANEPGAGVKEFLQPWWLPNNPPGDDFLYVKTVNAHLEFH